MQTTVLETYDCRFEGRDVLLFRHAADGTAFLLAVTDEEWRRALAAEEPAAPAVHTIRRLFAAADEPSSRVVD